jgi:hypothetical protein
MCPSIKFVATHVIVIHTQHKFVGFMNLGHHKIPCGMMGNHFDAQLFCANEKVFCYFFKLKLDLKFPFLNVIFKGVSRMAYNIMSQTTPQTP